MRKIKLLSLLLFIIFTSQIIYAQVTQEWAKLYNGPGNNTDNGTCLAVDNYGNIYSAGSSFGSGTGLDYVLIKYNSSGLQQWIQRYNGTGNNADNISTIKIDKSGNIYVTGNSRGNGADFDYVTIKYNSNGSQIWLQRYNGTANYDDYPCSMGFDDSSNVYITGYSFGSGTDYDCVTIKYDSSGVQKWVQRYNGPTNGYDNAYSLIVDDSSNVYITGESDGNGNTWNCITIKYNSSGVQQWVQRYSGSYCSGIDIKSDNNYVYVAGYTGDGGLNRDFLTIKYNKSGTQQWANSIGGSSWDVARSIAIDASGNIYETGEYVSGATKYGTVKYNSSGVLQWIKIYTGPYGGGDSPNSIVLDKYNNVYVTGGSPQTENKSDIATVKYNSNGVQQWVQRYPGIGDGYDGGSFVYVDSMNNVFVVGGSSGSNNYLDMVTLKYSQIVNIEPKLTEISENFRLSQNYPNPFNPTTNIRFSIPPYASPFWEGGKGDVLLKVFDILGNEVSTLVNEQLKPGTYEVEFNGDNYASGVYYYTLQTESFNQTKRMVLVK